MEMSKSDFARHIGVSPGRISQYLKAGIIGPDALTSSARIVVEKAVEQIKLRRHVGQAMGNGLLTKLDEMSPAPASSASTPAADPLKGSDDLAKQIQQERLEQEQRRNRREARDEALQLGQLVSGEDHKREVGKTAQTLVTTFMGMAPDIANAIAAKFSLQQRDVLFEVRRVMNEKRAQAAIALRLAAEDLPETAEAELEVA
jgi:hypothetical protein